MNQGLARNSILRNATIFEKFTTEFRKMQDRTGIQAAGELLLRSITCDQSFDDRVAEHYSVSTAVDAEYCHWLERLRIQ